MELVVEAAVKAFGMEKRALEKWTKAPNYGGEDFSAYYVGLGRTRDSGPGENSNYEAAKAILQEAARADEAEWEEKGLDLDEEPPFIEEHARHFAVGWLETLLVHEQATHALAALQDIESRMEDYSVLDEEDLSQREWDEVQQAWYDWAEKEVIKELNMTELVDEEFQFLSQDTRNKIMKALADAFFANAEHTGSEVVYNIDRVEKSFDRNLADAGIVPIRLYDTTMVGVWDESDIDQLIQDYGEDEIDMSNEPSRIHPGQQQLPFMAEGKRHSERPVRKVGRRKQAAYETEELDLGVYVEYTANRVSGEKATYDYPGSAPYIEIDIKSAEMDWVGDLTKYPQLMEALSASIEEHEGEKWNEEAADQVYEERQRHPFGRRRTY